MPQRESGIVEARYQKASYTVKGAERKSALCQITILSTMCWRHR